MQDKASLSADQLVSETRRLVREELRVGLQVLEHLREIERRRIFLDRGHGSLFAFCIRELGYSEPQAQLRIDAMRALRDTPEIEESVRAGELNVTAVARVQRFLRREKARTGAAVPKGERLALFTRAKGKSTRELDQALLALSPESAVPSERERVLDADRTELRIVLSAELRDQLDALKALLSHRMRDPGSTVELLGLLARQTLEKLQGKPERTVAPMAPAVQGEARARFIPVAVRRGIWRRDGGSCAFRDPRTGQRCGSRHYLQIDHRVPFSARGPSRDPRNLRLLCGPHNRAAWAQWREGRRPSG
jgi:hypothetical protein